MPVKTHETPANWRPLPRYIFRKRNILHELNKIDDVYTFIDIGCGAGDLACSLAEQGLTGKGYDFSKSAINTANELRKERGLSEKEVKFIQNQDDLSELKDKADLVLCLEVLEHIEDDKRAFNELLRLSNKYLVISVPAKQKLFSYSDELAGHFRRYDVDDIVKLVRTDKTRIRTIINYGYPFTNMVRWARESRSKKETSKDKDIYDRSKKSGVSIFEEAPKAGSLNLEKLMTGPYYISRAFNKADFGEGYLLVIEKV